jgi:hypothetical protein
VAVLVLVGVVTIVWYLRRRRRLAPLRAALAELRQLRERSTARGDKGALAVDVSVLLRRVAMACFPHREVAALTGEAWLAFLDKSGGAGGFSSGPGRALATAPYRPGEDYETEKLMDLAGRWVVAVCRNQRRRT